jgi:hypothetical protein
MKYKGIELRQGTVSDDKEDTIILICAKDDIRGYAEEHDIKLTKKQIEHIFQRLVRKGSDYVMEQFWSVIECEVDNVMYEVKDKCIAKGEELK